MNYEKANAITARECDVAVYSSAGCLWIRQEFDTYIEEEWTIEDPRCREVIRGHYRIDTDSASGDSYWISGNDIVNAKGKTIAEAEIQCILKICETDNA